MMGVVLSSPVINSVQPPQPAKQPIETTKPENTTGDANVSVSQTEEVTQPINESNHVIEVTKSTDDGVTKGTFLAVSSASMGRSSRYLFNLRLFLYNMLKQGNSYRE